VVSLPGCGVCIGVGCGVCVRGFGMYVGVRCVFKWGCGVCMGVRLWCVDVECMWGVVFMGVGVWNVNGCGRVMCV
jgi:hypothetical protein